MKKIIFTVAILAFTAGLQAQSKTKTKSADGAAPATSAPAAAHDEKSNNNKAELSTPSGNMHEAQAPKTDKSAKATKKGAKNKNTVVSEPAPTKQTKSDTKTSGAAADVTIMPDGTAVPASNGETTKKPMGGKAETMKGANGVQASPSPAGTTNKPNSTKTAAPKNDANSTTPQKSK